MFVLACAGERPPAQRPATVSASNVSLPETVTFQTDVAPIAALTFSRGFLWIGSARGLRRVRLPGGPAEWIERKAGASVRGVTALGTDRSGRVLIGTDSEVGRVSEPGGTPRYETVAKLLNVRRLAPVIAPGAGDGIWVGTTTGLSFLDGGNAYPIETPRGAAVTSLDVDADGKSAWVGVAGHGLFHVDGRKVIAAFGPESPGHIDFVESLGTALLPNGTRIAVGRGARGETRLMLLRLAGPEVLSTDASFPVWAVVSQRNDAASTAGAPLLVGGTATAPRLYRLATTERGEVVGAGVFRFSPNHRNLEAERMTARPDPRVVPPDITIAMTGDAGTDDVFVGTRSVGVARLADGGPDYVPGGELALGARGLSVACLEQERCVFATGTGPGWIWEGGDHAMKPIPEGAIGGDLMALAGDGRSNVYFVAAGPGKALRIARLSGDGAHWEPLLTLPVQVEGVPIVTFATLSPKESMWMAVSDRTPTGQEFGRGVIELPLLPVAGRAVHHVAHRERYAGTSGALPIAGDVASVRFQKGTDPASPEAAWFCTSLGVTRSIGGQLSHWGENEGLDSETCHDLEIASDGTVWVATEKGVAWFDGKGWRRLGSRGGVDGKSTHASRWPLDREGEGVAARALVASGETLWAGTAHGLWPLGVTAAPIDRTNGLVDEDVVHLAADRFGRIWVLGRLGLTVRRPR